MAGTLETREISAPRVGKFNIHIQGNLKQCQFVIMTVHDLGCNYATWKQFIDLPCMEEIRKRAAFIHVDIPGQEDGAADLPSDYTFPSMQTLGEDLVCILDQLEVKQVVAIGEGAGANIIVRFAIVHPGRTQGLCLIHCTGTTAGFMESLKDKVMNWKLDHIGMNPTAESYLMLHRFGSVNMFYSFYFYICLLFIICRFFMLYNVIHVYIYISAVIILCVHIDLIVHLIV